MKRDDMRYLYGDPSRSAGINAMIVFMNISNRPIVIHVVFSDLLR